MAGWSVKMDEIPDDRAVMVFDGVCLLCSGTVRWIIARDPEARIAFAAAQGAVGQSVYRRLGLSTTVFESFLFVSNGKVWQRSDGFIELMRVLGWPWRILAILRFVPSPVRDWAYRTIANNRYKWFGRTDQCMVPDARDAARFL
jgi:predicted DCC family thiol-disulfide oxidoreductase YuxK